MKLEIIIASTRPGRVGKSVGEWFIGQAKAHSKFEQIGVADLAEINLPFIDEPQHPAMLQYTHEHTKAWSKRIEAADAFIVVTPEYDYFMPATLVNAIGFLFKEWNYKPFGFVSYGGLSGGLRSVQSAKLIVTGVKMFPIWEAVAIPFVHNFIKDGVFSATPDHEKAAAALLDETYRVAETFKPLHTN